MSLFDWINENIKKCVWYDISLIKLSTAAFILMVAKLWAPILALEWYWYLLIAVLAGIKPAMKMFGKQNPESV